jgi:hypothetical protein
VLAPLRDFAFWVSEDWGEDTATPNLQTKTTTNEKIEKLQKVGKIRKKFENIGKVGNHLKNFEKLVVIRRKQKTKIRETTRQSF